jgi:hypothetical protein
MLFVNMIFLSVWAPAYVADFKTYEKRKMLQMHGVLPGMQNPIAPPRRRFIGKAFGPTWDAEPHRAAKEEVYW